MVTMDAGELHDAAVPVVGPELEPSLKGLGMLLQ